MDEEDSLTDWLTEWRLTKREKKEKWLFLLLTSTLAKSSRSHRGEGRKPHFRLVLNEEVHSGIEATTWLLFACCFFFFFFLLLLLLLFFFFGDRQAKGLFLDIDHIQITSTTTTSVSERLQNGSELPFDGRTLMYSENMASESNTCLVHSPSPYG